MGRCVEFYQKWERVPNWCGKCSEAVRQIENYILLVKELEDRGIPKETTFVGLTEGAARPLFSEKDIIIREKVIKKIVNDLNSKKWSGKGHKKKYTANDVEKLITHFKDERRLQESDIGTQSLPPIHIKAKPGKWYKLGVHLLYCGDSSSEEFKSKAEGVSFAFADCPYNAGVAKWDNNFDWSHDWLIEKAPIVAITPGINSIATFLKKTQMPYIWSIACHIENGCAYGNIGFANWIYIALFSKTDIFFNCQDFIKIALKTSENEETKHKGRKPSGLMQRLYEIFTKPDDTILDPFLGSGTSLLVAEKMKRKCIGAEISPDFCNEIIQRWEALTGEKAMEN